MDFSIIVASTRSHGIGKDGSIPWHLPSDMLRFKNRTMHGAVIMGRATFDSLKSRPLLGRLNIVISRRDHPDYPPGVRIAGSLDEALSVARDARATHAHVMGGASIYDMAVDHPRCVGVEWTEILSPDFACDTFLSDRFVRTVADLYSIESLGDVQTDPDRRIDYRFLTWRRKSTSIL